MALAISKMIGTLGRGEEEAVGWQRHSILPWEGRRQGVTTIGRAAAIAGLVAVLETARGGRSLELGLGHGSAWIGCRELGRKGWIVGREEEMK
jgi:hypothetical protein